MTETVKLNKEELDNFRDIMLSVADSPHPPDHNEYMKGYSEGIKRVFNGVYEIIEDTDQ